MESLGIKARPLSAKVYELRLEGALDWSNFAQVETALEDIFSKKCYNIIVNLSGCKYISSAGFGCFLQALDTAMNNNGKIIFSSVPESIREVFDMLGLSNVLVFADTDADALKQF